jgi:hypothetical protein
MVETMFVAPQGLRCATEQVEEDSNFFWERLRKIHARREGYVLF